MLFNSLQFVVFFPVTVLLYYILPHRYRWVLLLLASSIFYMAFIPAYVAVIFAVIVLDYTAGLLIEKGEGRRRKSILFAGIFLTCLILFLFKYLGFVEQSIAGAARLFHWHYAPHVITVLLPVGLSFHTFQGMSYMIEVYKGTQKAERHFGYYSLYIMFFPQLVAGPIERPRHMLPQFREEHRFSYDMAMEGIKLMAWGFFKKVVVADRLGILVGTVYAHPREFDGLSLLLATIFFAFQIYCDFSGYSDIAIGSARVLGFRLVDNFRRPYYAGSIAEFWQRWHISLSTWFRDYLYIPLGGNRVVRSRWCANILFTFAVSGIWHGANWTFLTWGLLHGIYYLLSDFTRGGREILGRLLHLTRHPVLHRHVKVCITFAIVAFAWIFFVSNNLGDAFYVATHLFSGISGSLKPSHVLETLSLNRLGLDHIQLAIAVLGILTVQLVEGLPAQGQIADTLSRKSPLLRWSFYYVLVMAILTLGVFDNMKTFIYFQF